MNQCNCGNLLNFLQNREVGGGFGLFGGRKVACCEIKKVQCQSVCREVCPDNPCLDENTLRAKHPYVMHISLWRGDRASAKSRKEVHGTVWCSGRVLILPKILSLHMVKLGVRP